MADANDVKSLMEALAGHVVGVQEDDPSRVVLVGSNSRPSTVYSAKAIDDRLRAHSPQPATTASVADARAQGRSEAFESFRLARELCPQQTPAQPTVTTATPVVQCDVLFIKGNVATRSGDMAVHGYVTEEVFHRLSPGIIQQRHVDAFERRHFPGWAWALIALGIVGLIWGIYALVSAPSANDAKSAQDSAAAWQKRAEIAEAAPKTMTVSIGEVKAGEVKAGPVTAGAVTATGAITATGEVTTGPISIGSIKAGEVTAEGAVTVNNTVTKNVTTTRVVHDSAPSAPAPTAQPVSQSSPTAVVMPNQAQCIGWWAYRVDGSALCISNYEAARATACGDRIYTGTICDAGDCKATQRNCAE